MKRDNRRAKTEKAREIGRSVGVRAMKRVPQWRLRAAGSGTGGIGCWYRETTPRDGQWPESERMTSDGSRRLASHGTERRPWCARKAVAEEALWCSEETGGGGDWRPLSRLGRRAVEARGSGGYACFRPWKESVWRRAGASGMPRG